MDFNTILKEATNHNEKSFSFITSKNYEIEFFKMNKKDKSFSVFVKKPNTNVCYKIGLVRDIDLLREAFNI